MPRTVLVFFLTAIALLSGAAMAAAADLYDVLTGYTLTSWTRRDGLPPGAIFALAQDGDGYLWVGTDAGLSRFDGVKFAPWVLAGDQPLPPQPVRVLYASRDGSIWVGFAAAGGIARITGTRVQRFGPSGGLGQGEVNFITEDADGQVWAGDVGGVYRLIGDRWTRVGASEGLPEEAGQSAYIDSRGTLCIGTRTGLFRRGRGEAVFQRLESPDEYIRSMVEDSTGQMWVTDPVVGFRLAGHSRNLAREAQRGRGRRLLHDRLGNLWVATGGQGLWKVRIDPALADGVDIERTQSSMGLPADGIVALLEDRDGNIWAGTADGLSRLTRHSVTPLSTAGLVGAIDTTPDGRVWVATTDGLLRYDGNLSRTEPARIWTPSSGIRALHADPEGTVWAATEYELARILGDKVTRLDFSRGPSPRQISLITSTPNRGLLIYDLEQGLLRLTPRGLEPVTLAADLAATRVTTLYTDRSGVMWLAFGDGRLANIDLSGHVKVFEQQGGVATGLPRTFHEDRQGRLWIGGTLGLIRHVGGMFSTFGHDEGFELGGITSITEDMNGMLWIGTTIGIVRLDPQQCDEVLERRVGRLRYRLVDRSDGLAGVPFWYGTRSAATTPDGRVWFVTSRGVTVIEPKDFGQNAEPAPVRLESVTADGRRFAAEDLIRLPPRPARIEIEYGHLNLTAPQKTRFRYQLDGVDPDWVEADGRRHVEYANLPPGTYRFRVVASANDGTWAESAAAWSFAVLPLFYETWWFYALCALGTGGVVLAAWRLRLQQLNARFEGLLSERMRLSRVIHDTLLQSLVGVAFQCDAIAGDLADLSPDKADRFTRLRRQVQDYIREARQSIWELRSQRLEGTDLPTALRKLCEQVIADRPVELEFHVRGIVKPCPDRVEQQLMLIGQEALLNAVRHGHARVVRVDLEYTRTSLKLRVSDDGSGFDAASVNYEIAGHYGLSTMRERAQDLGGGLTIDSGVGRGTAVEAVVPALRSGRAS